MEIGIDSAHLMKTVRLNLPCERETFRDEFLESSDSSAHIVAGTQIRRGFHHQILGPDPADNTSKPQGVERTPVSQEPTWLALVSTIQFVAALQKLKEDLSVELDDSPPSLLVTNQDNVNGSDDIESALKTKLWSGKYITTIPRSKPLSPGEILGCTAPLVRDVDALLWVFLLIHA